MSARLAAAGLAGRVWPSVTRRWADPVVTVVAVVVVGGPAIFTHSGFMIDYTNHLWLVGVQEHAISQHLAPTYFISGAPVGVFYPFFMFYGGTLYAIAGAAAAALGGATLLAYVGVSLLSIASAYGGWVWLGRQLGVRSWAAHAPPVTFVASAYYVTNLYGRGAWPEFVATSMLPLLVASGWSLGHGRRMTVGSSVLFAVAAIVLAGSHNVTLLVGAVVGALAALLLWPAVGRGFAPPPGRAVRIVALLVVSCAVDAWFLLPDVVNSSHTMVGHAAPTPAAFTAFLDQAGVLFDPLRTVPKVSSTPALFVQVPDWSLAWALIACAVLWTVSDRRLRRSALALGTLLLALLAAIMIDPVWDGLPYLLREAQFPYRLNTYVALVIAGLVLVGVLAVEAAPPGVRRRGLGLGLIGSTAVATGLCVWQLWVPMTGTPGSYASINDVPTADHVLPKTWYDGNYEDGSGPLVPGSRHTVTINPARVQDNRATVTISPPRGRGPFATNITSGPYALHLVGDVVGYGRTPSGALVLRRAPQRRRGPIRLSMSTAGGAVDTGRIISELAIGLLVVALVAAGAVRLRRRRTS